MEVVAVEKNGDAVGEPRSGVSVRLSRERKGAEHKRTCERKSTYKEINVELTGRQEQKWEKRTRELKQKLKNAKETMRINYDHTKEVEADKGILNMLEDKKGETENMALNEEAIAFSSIPSDPGENGRFGGPEGKFWAGPADEEMDQEIVEETQLEVAGPLPCV
ncbi:hypothetical protein K1719_005639 [Acacia pycnantha]|nr:hypothetical protein K1719_005639 [Acacia pycnantha]